MLSFMQFWSTVRWVESMTLDGLPLPKEGGVGHMGGCAIFRRKAAKFVQIRLRALAIQVTRAKITPFDTA